MGSGGKEALFRRGARCKRPDAVLKSSDRD
jgi:hypothetical protein